MKGTGSINTGFTWHSRTISTSDNIETYNFRGIPVIYTDRNLSVKSYRRFRSTLKILDWNFCRCLFFSWLKGIQKVQRPSQSQPIHIKDKDMIAAINREIKKLNQKSILLISLKFKRVILFKTSRLF